MKSNSIHIQLLGACAALLLSTVEVHAVGATFYSGRDYTGTASQNLPDGSYTTAQMVAKGCLDDWANSTTISSNHSVLLYSNNNFGGTLNVYSESNKCIPGDTSSIKVQTGVPSGHVSKYGGGSITEFQAGFLYGDWLLFYAGSWIELKSNGGASKYTVRYETEYWNRSGTITPPTVQVTSGTNVRNSTSGTSALGTCTGTAFPQEAYYTLNGRVKWTNNESGCHYNLGLRDAW